MIIPIKANTEVVRESLTPEKKAIAQLKQQFMQQTSLIEQMTMAIQPVAKHLQIVSQNIEQINLRAEIASTQAKKEKENLIDVNKNINNLQTNVINSIGTIKNIEQLSIDLIGTVPLAKKIILQAELLAEDINKIDDREPVSLSQKMQKIAVQLVALISEIEAIGESIQRQTSGVIRTMEVDFDQNSETSSVAESNYKYMDKVHQNFIAIKQVLQFTNNSTKTQIATLEKITNLTTELSLLSENNLSQSERANNYLKETEIAVKKLEESVNTFKLADRSRL